MLGLTLAQAATLLIGVATGIGALLGGADVWKSITQRRGRKQARRREIPNTADESDQADHDKGRSERSIDVFQEKDATNITRSDTNVASMVNDYLGVDRILQERLDTGEDLVSNNLALERNGEYHINSDFAPEHLQSRLKSDISNLNRGIAENMNMLGAMEDYVAEHTGIGMGALVQSQRDGAIHKMLSPKIPDEANQHELRSDMSAPAYEELERVSQGGIRSRVGKTARRAGDSAVKVGNAVRNRAVAGFEGLRSGKTNAQREQQALQGAQAQPARTGPRQAGAAKPRTSGP